jgi:catechol 2,3-dioxygenase-like lactoylglutathione lyase family enzyme
MPALDAVLYAKDLAAMSRFYAAVLGGPPVHTDATIAVHAIGESRLTLHAIPAHIAETFTIAVPPELREEAAIKLTVPVASLGVARDAASANGGGCFAPDREWEFEGRRYVDGWDPEGNVVQFAASSSR